MTGFEASVLVAAVGVAAVHTVFGPDHYLPFLMIGRARGWSRRKVASAAALCGVAHVASSLLLGCAGVALGWTVARIEAVEGGRGSLAAWLLVAFGVTYAVWGTRRALRHAHGLAAHNHADIVHVHAEGELPHTHGPARKQTSTAFWTLFTVFILGPCEPLIPLFILPASRGEYRLAALAALIFAVVTIGLMALITYVGSAGLERLRLGAAERWSHALAGAVVAASGLAVIFLGL